MTIRTTSLYTTMLITLLAAATALAEGVTKTPVPIKWEDTSIEGEKLKIMRLPDNVTIIRRDGVSHWAVAITYNNSGFGCTNLVPVIEDFNLTCGSGSFFYSLRRTNQGPLELVKVVVK